MISVESALSLITAMAALSATGVAWVGLFSWKKKAKWEEQRKFAREYFSALHEVRASVRFLTSSDSIEIESQHQIFIDRCSPEARLHWHNHFSVLARVNRLLRDMKSLMALEPEAVIHWGSDFEVWHRDVFALSADLGMCLSFRAIAENPDVDQDTRARAALQLTQSGFQADSIEDSVLRFSQKFDSEFDKVRRIVGKKLR